MFTSAEQANVIIENLSLIPSYGGGNGRRRRAARPRGVEPRDEGGVRVLELWAREVSQRERSGAECQHTSSCLEGPIL